MKLTITRSEWLRGEGFLPSRLVRSQDNKMCCLGFLGVACGIPKEKMMNIGSPFYLNQNKWPEKLISNLDTGFGACQNLMAINDTQSLNDPEREAELTKEFASIDIQVEFTE